MRTTQNTDFSGIAVENSNAGIIFRKGFLKAVLGHFKPFWGQLKPQAPSSCRFCDLLVGNSCRQSK